MSWLIFIEHKFSARNPEGWLLHPEPSAVAITLCEAERAELVRRAGLPGRRLAERSRIIRASADGMSNAGSARAVGVAVKTVGKWRRGFVAPGQLLDLIV
ncbi:helix-turn-helix domain-containing protein [Streptomyces inhibens]|uniref:helix-turn-helix domain-containing protein n=1 Tax=Streptomyces inhibens TaxID=2293571 RepID=UPI00378A3229